MQVILRIVILISAFALTTIRAYAQEPRATPQWDIAVWSAFATGEENQNSLTQAQFFSAGVLVGKTILPHLWRGNLEYGLSLMPIFIHLRPQILYGGGFEPVILRWNSNWHVKHFAPYIELSGGGLWTSGNIPAGNTSTFNFTPKAGGGFSLSRGSHRALDLGCRWSHISNANLGLRNPEFNGIEMRMTYHWFR